MAFKSEINPSQIKIVYCDNDIVVVDKPSGITTVRHPHEIKKLGSKKKFLPVSLAQLLPAILKKKQKGKKRRGTQPPLKAVHRIDKETSGLVVFARNSKAASHLGEQFKNHTIERRYRAVVCGDVFPGKLETMIARDRGDGIRGTHPTKGKKAITNIIHAKALSEGYSMVDCELETGRTHQIRIQLAEIGHPICGEKVYLKRFKRKKLRDSSGAERIALHAMTLGFSHPRTGKKIHFNSPLPTDIKRLIKKLERQKKAS